MLEPSTALATERSGSLIEIRHGKRIGSVKGLGFRVTVGMGAAPPPSMGLDVERTALSRLESVGKAPTPRREAATGS